jgi:DNA-damage-inducible protein J
MLKTAIINVRMTPEVKKQAEELFSSFGISLSDAFNLFVHQSIIEQRIPFQISRRVPNPDFRTAIDETEDIIQGKRPKPPAIPAKDLFSGMRANGEI